MSVKSILFRLNLASMLVTFIVWLLMFIAVEQIVSSLHQQEQQLFLRELVEQVEIEFGEIVDSAEQFESQLFDYDAFVELLNLDEEFGLVLWHNNQLAVSKLPEVAQQIDRQLLASMSAPTESAYMDFLPILPLDEVHAIAISYPDFDLVLLLMRVLQEDPDQEQALFWLFIALLAIGILLTGLLNWYLNKQALSPLLKFTDSLSQAGTGAADISIEQLPEELKGIGSEINRLNAHFAQLQLKKDVALDKEKLFTVNAAHELLTPLTVLKSEVQLVASQFKKDQYAESMNEINLRIDRVTKTIEQLVNLARLEPDQNQRASYTRLDLKLLFEDNQALFGHQIEAKQLDIVEPVDMAQNPRIQGNPEHISMLFKNLIENAVKYASVQGKLIYQLKDSDQGPVFTLENQCEPIPDFMKQQLFEAFARRPGQVQSGSGLGLAIVKQICLLHGYQISMTDSKNTLGVAVEVRF